MRGRPSLDLSDQLKLKFNEAHAMENYGVRLRVFNEFPGSAR